MSNPTPAAPVCILSEVIDLLENLRGNINPERGYAEELESDIEAMLAKLRTEAPAA